ncbi:MULTISPECIES: TetR/AcrR family transcriptional regulator [unclassified Streptomyces]|uniref:TetR/AcrR family transcriptional regulator n=1 Tax=unclassified Streptomyces TaxID=2593676 RepID=UPI00382629A0
MSSLVPPRPESAESVGEPQVLIQLGPVGDKPFLRADAARNRARLLDAAARLIAEHGVDGVTMEGVAAAAQVGKGTVFRRFGDRNGLLTALLDDSEQRMQAAFLTGPPPLGPGAPPVERLRAFGITMLRRCVDEMDLQLAAEPGPERRHSAPVRRVHHGHVVLLLRQAVPAADHDLLGHTLLGYLSPVLVHHLTRQRGVPLPRLEHGWCDLVDRVTGD